MLIFANIVQSHDDNDDSDDVVVHICVRRRFMAFFTFSNGAEIPKSLKISSPTFHFTCKTGSLELTELLKLPIW